MIEQILAGLILAIAFGLLEAAWTYPDRGGPYRTWLGVAAIFIGLFIVTFPYIWWIAGFAIFEEIVHLTTSSKPPYHWKERILYHWSTRYLGINIYPYITFPLITIIGQVAFWVVTNLYIGGY